MASSSVYGNELGEGFDSFWMKYQAMSPELRAELEENAQARFGNTA